MGPVQCICVDDDLLATLSLGWACMDDILATLV